MYFSNSATLVNKEIWSLEWEVNHFDVVISLGIISCFQIRYLCLRSGGDCPKAGPLISFYGHPDRLVGGAWACFGDPGRQGGLLDDFKATWPSIHQGWK